MHRPTIKALATYLPPNKVTNFELAKSLDTSDEWIRSHTGIESRYWAIEGQQASDMAVEAVKKLFLHREAELEAIDAIIVATTTGDYPGFPSTACLVQAKLELPNVAAFDIAAGCSGFVYALEIARSFIATGNYHSIVVLGAEKLSAITDFSDRSTAILFGDGCGALQLVSHGKGDIVDTVLHSEGHFASSLTVEPIKGKIVMDGRFVYNFAIRVIGETIDELLARNNLSLSEIDWIVPHQANNRIIEAAANRFKIAKEKFFVNIAQYANTSAASIPIALDEMVQKGLLKRGQLIITLGFGAGLTYGGNLIRW